MNQQRKIFTKGDRELLHGILSGKAAKTNGVPVQRFLAKIRDNLQKKKVCLDLTTEKINQIIWWKTNNQDVWQAAYEVASDEHAGLFEELQEVQLSEAVI